MPNFPLPSFLRALADRFRPRPKPSTFSPLALGLFASIAVVCVVGVVIVLLLPRTAAHRGDAKARDAFVNGTDEVLPAAGIDIPVAWGDLGAKLVSAGVIDKDKFEALYASRGGLDPVEKRMLEGSGNGRLHMDAANSGFLLDLLWAFGLAQKSAVLTGGMMVSSGPQGAARFASTGGWTLGKDDAMTYYAKSSLVALTPEQDALVTRVTGGIYRPCCDNSSAFPDCNHGMAMLGLMELMANQGATEAEMYRVALQVNAYWFPSEYLTIAKAFAARGIAWKDVDPREALSRPYSSASGYGMISRQVGPVQAPGAQGCGA